MFPSFIGFHCLQVLISILLETQGHECAGRQEFSLRVALLPFILSYELQLLLSPRYLSVLQLQESVGLPCSGLPPCAKSQKFFQGSKPGLTLFLSCLSVITMLGEKKIVLYILTHFLFLLCFCFCFFKEGKIHSCQFVFVINECYNYYLKSDLQMLLSREWSERRVPVIP